MGLNFLSKNELAVKGNLYETSWWSAKAKTPPFCKGGPGGISYKRLKIPLNPPFTKGDFHDPNLTAFS